MSAFAMLEDDLDLSTGNLRVEKDLDICTAQKLTNRFRLFLGEWFMDIRVGVPYYQVVYIKNPDLQAVAQLFKRVCLQTPRISDVATLNVDFISTLRHMNVSLAALTDSGAVITGGPGLPFVVTQNGKGTN